MSSNYDSAQLISFSISIVYNNCYNFVHLLTHKSNLQLTLPKNRPKNTATVPKTDIMKPHVIFIPYPQPSAIKSMLKLAELFHHKGLRVTFVNTEMNHKRFLESGGPHCLDGSPGFHFITIPDQPTCIVSEVHSGLQLWNKPETKFIDYFYNLMTSLPNPPTCIISDGLMSSFTIDVAQKLKIPVMLFWAIAACSYMCFYQLKSLVEKGIVPLKDTSQETLEKTLDWIPGIKGIRIKDLPSFVWTEPNGRFFNYLKEATQRSHKVSHNIIYTFDELEGSIVDALSSMFSHVYTVGPMQLLLDQIPKEEKETEEPNFNGYSLFKEEPECLKWLESKKPNSVIYVSVGSSALLSREDLIELGWGLANSNHYFLWIIRTDMVLGESAVLPPEYADHIKERGFIASWCSQEEVLNHGSVGGFLTHCGWSSTIESLTAGVPMICRPVLGDQMTDCRYTCNEWGVGLEMEGNLKRENVEKLVRELMGETGQKLRNKAMDWKAKAQIATAPNGSSALNVDKLVKEIAMLSST
ncbi:UDP-glycosyltransferase 85C2-like [Rutidosis leptorrhynchoides]|uniref:UDP-glycosyltransferase 85C2-like n=1 Tax=Rutidosis leptorrhynchoides TaxID=125765 RepID=UPI003A990A74